MNHVKLIQAVAKHTRYESYLELGIADGTHFAAIAPYVSRAHAVDMQDTRHQSLKAFGEFFLMSTDEYFAENRGTFDIIFIDANHDIAFARSDLANSLKILNWGGVIFMHDTDPENKQLSESRFCGDSYLVNQVSREDILDIVTLPLDNSGLTIIRRRNECRYNRWITQ